MDFLKKAILWVLGIAVVGTITLTTGLNYLADRDSTQALATASSMHADVRNVRLGLFSGARLNGVSLSEDSDGDTPMWKADSVHLDVAPETLSHSLVPADTLTIQNLQLFLERRNRSDANYRNLSQNWVKLLQKLPEPEQHDRKYLISEVRISGLNIRAIDRATARGPSDVGVKTDSIHFSAVGQTRNGLTLPELTATVLYGVLHHVAYREKELPPELTRDLRMLLRKLPVPDAELPSRPHTLGEKAVDSSQEFFDKAMDAIDRFMEGEDAAPGPASSDKETGKPASSTP